MNRWNWLFAAGAVLTFVGCGDAVSDSARVGFSGRTSAENVLCAEFLDVFPDDALKGDGYFFGDVAAMEPILDRVRQNTRQRDVFLSDTYECRDYGLAALRMKFTNVQASWNPEVRDLEVLVAAENLMTLDTSPVIDPSTHALKWATREGTRATFPGAGTRLGMPIKGSLGGVHVGVFENVMEVRADGQVKLHYRNVCNNFYPERFPDEASVLTHLRGLSDASTLDFSRDLSWYVTSVCEYP